MKKVVVLTGAGISAESGLKTFRDSDGLWEGYRIEEVATPEAWRRDQNLVLDFYNMRRRALEEASPNAAHLALVKLEERYKVTIITQNVDDLHERAGSSEVVHLHGELCMARSTKDASLVRHIGYKDIVQGDKCSLGSQLRPHIVWFGEAVPMMDKAIEIIETADIILVIGTSLVVYPAAGLMEYAKSEAHIAVVDKKIPPFSYREETELIEAPATVGVPSLVERLIQKTNAKIG